jgi:hypothetical protein
MSSHHFVKEGQEPALLIAEQLIFEEVGSLLEWAPLIIVLEQALEQTLLWGIKADFVLCLPESLENIKQLVAHQMPVTLIPCPASEMFNKGLDLLIANGQRYTNVCVNAHINYFERSEKYADRIEIALYDGKIKWSAINTGKFKKWLPEDSVIYVKCHHPFDVTEGEVKINGNELTLLSDCLITIQCNTSFWVGETLK